MVAAATHQGNLRTFEVLPAYTGPNNPALIPIVQIVHDIDLEDE